MQTQHIHDSREISYFSIVMIQHLTLIGEMRAGCLSKEDMIETALLLDRAYSSKEKKDIMRSICLNTFPADLFYLAPLSIGALVQR